MKNIHILPTNKPSRIYLIKSNNKLGITSNNPDFTENFGSGTQNQHIYITNSEVKKNGDWVLSKLNEIVKFCSLYCQNSYEKIILTTDQSLDGVQSIDDDFLEWFVKNPSCEFVEVVTHYPTISDEGDYSLSKQYYTINIPKEEPKQETLEEYIEREGYPEGPTQDIWEQGVREGVKWQAEQLYKDDVIQTLEKGLAVLLKRQERMYSEEEVIQFVEWLGDSRCLDDTYKANIGWVFFMKNEKGKDFKPTKELLKEWFEQFKKK